jgi:hypothetical protein
MMDYARDVPEDKLILCRMNLYCGPDKTVEQANKEQAEVIHMLTNKKLALQAQLRDLQSQDNDPGSTNDRINVNVNRREELSLTIALPKCSSSFP